MGSPPGTLLLLTGLLVLLLSGRSQAALVAFGNFSTDLQSLLFGQGTAPSFLHKPPSPPVTSITSACGATTSTSTILSTPGYPVLDQKDRACVLHVLPPAGTCGVRVRLVDAVFTDPLCRVSSLVLTGPGAAYGGSDPFCSNISGYSLTVPLRDPNSPEEVTVVASYRAPFRFRAVVEIIPCSSTASAIASGPCGRVPHYRQGRGRKHKNGGKKKNKNRNRGNQDSATDQGRQGERLSQDFIAFVDGILASFGALAAVVPSPPVVIPEPPPPVPSPLDGTGFEDLNELIISPSIILEEPFESEHVELPIADREDYPWTVRVDRLDRGTSDGIVQCGGALVAADLVLTSASCLWDLTLDAISVTVAETFRNGGTARRKVDVTEVRYHYAYRDLRYARNLALLKLAQPLTFSDTLSPVCLPAADESLQALPVGGTGIHAGHDFFGIFRAVPQTRLARSVCSLRFPTVEPTADVICTEPNIINVPHYQCPIEQGGPLVGRRSVGGRFVLVGVHSSGSICAYDPSLAIYSDVAANLDWIILNLI